MYLGKSCHSGALRARLGPLVWVAAALALSAATAQDAPQATQGNLWAILVGVNDYAELEDLQYCRKDVEALAEQLVKVGFPRDGVFVLTDGAADAKNHPTKVNLETRLKNVLQVAEPGDLVLVSFSGHGVCVAGKTYLCPSDARLDNPEATMIPLQLVYGSLEQSHASRKLLWVDACRNDPRPSGARSAGTHEEDVAGIVKSLAATPEGILTLASCATDQISWEDEQLGHGVFMHFLMEGLSGKADAEEKGNRDACVSIFELYNYANIKTTRFVLNRRDRKQTPELFGRVTGDFDLVRLDVRPVMPPKPVGPAETITNTHGMQLKLIPAGEFLMGSPDGEAERESDEGPPHRVRITKPFYLGVYEVTQAQYTAVIGKNPSRFQGADLPVESVSWEEAAEFCRRLSAKEGRAYRLPTEAEWEYACRAGTTTPFAFGETLSSDRDANYAGDFAYGRGVKGRDVGKTTPVGSYRANGWGLYDMHGNVWEWCADWYGEDYYAGSPSADPPGPATGSDRVLRGGCWGDYPWGCRSASRNRSAPVSRGSLLGFRLALVAE